MLTEYNALLQNVNMLIQFADPELEANLPGLLELPRGDLAGVIGTQYGIGEKLIEGIHAGVLRHLPVQRIRVRKPAT